MRSFSRASIWPSQARIWAVSALRGDGLDRLVHKIAHRLWQEEVLPQDDAWARAAREAMFAKV